MQAPFVIIGLGQLGSWFQQVWQGAGRSVVPVTRSSDWTRLHEQNPEPELVLVAVGEDELAGVLARLPSSWRERVVLLQNELRPRQWLSHGLVEPTALVVWFERKNGLAPLPVRESVVSGPHAAVVEQTLKSASLGVKGASGAALYFELALKNLYILSLNLCGLDTRGTAGALLNEQRALFSEVTAELLALERALFGTLADWDDSALLAALEQAILADPGHGTAGRSAPRRLARTLEHARALALETPVLDALAARHL